MIFIEMPRVMRMFGVAVVGVLLVNSAGAQQKSHSTQSAEALLKDLGPAGLTQTGVRIQPVQPNDLTRSLSKNQHALMSPPPARIVLSLAEASLPATSRKRFTLLGMSKSEFLTPTRVRPTDWQHLNLPKVDASELQNDKHPNVAPE